MTPFQTVLVNRTDKTIRYTTQPSVTLIPGAEVRLPYDVFTKFSGDVNIKLLLRDIKEGRVVCAGIVHRDAFAQIVMEPIFEGCSAPVIETAPKAIKPIMVEDTREALPFGKTPDDVVKHVPNKNGFDGNTSKPVDESKDWGAPPKETTEVTPAPVQVVEGTADAPKPVEAPVTADTATVSVPAVTQDPIRPSDVIPAPDQRGTPALPEDGKKKRGGRKPVVKL